jgi:hypothetical protein
VIEVAASPAHSGERRRATGKYYALERPGEHAPNNYRDFAMLSFTARAATYTISSYPAGLAEVSCDAFKKNADGWWTQVAILIAGGALIPAGSNFKNTAETRIIEKKCDKE